MFIVMEIKNNYPKSQSFNESNKMVFGRKRKETIRNTVFQSSREIKIFTEASCINKLHVGLIYFFVISTNKGL